MSLIFVIIDKVVEDGRHICNALQGQLRNRGPICPRICTFDMGSYCSHNFLKMLAQIGRGYYDADPLYWFVTFISFFLTNDNIDVELIY
ncbi:unnamed protein product, partial [Vitis vinifera]|uniref:Uncharacterized protein n=1 Tax=Vitis vinifera TaxID=29760 RepID=D7UE52_VITVI